MFSIHEYFYIESLKEGVFLTDNLLIFLSNNIRYKEKKFIIYNVNSEKIEKEINLNYSINLSKNSLTLIEMNNNDNNKILLCACKKYLKNQKNGILLINICLRFDGVEDYFNCFYETNSFEVYCFCQVSIFKKDNSKILKEKYSSNKTNYFLVGGFEKRKNQGIIKLYKLISSENKIEIKYIEDVVINPKKNNHFKSFNGPILCIIQSNQNGNILISCWDGNVYLLDCPNVDYYDKVEININEILKKN